MGHNTTVVILNDALHHIREDKDFGCKIADGASVAHNSSPVNVWSGGFSSAARIVDTHHASNYRIILVGGNDGLALYPSFSVDLLLQHGVEGLPLVLARELARTSGYYIAKKRKT